jgi:hypothetical protein
MNDAAACLAGGRDPHPWQYYMYVVVCTSVVAAMGWVFSEGKLQVAAHFKDDSERDPAPREHPSGIDETGFVRREGGGARMTGGNAPRVSTCCSCMRFSKWTPPADLDALMTAAVVVRCVFECLVCLDWQSKEASIHSNVDSLVTLCG